jgi:hypothetical protein
MSFHEEMKESEMAFEAIMTERRYADAYRHVTADMGPSQQLIDFINYDGSFAQSFSSGQAMESMTTVDQHTALLTMLDPKTSDTLIRQNLIQRIASMKTRIANETGMESILYHLNAVDEALANVSVLDPIKAQCISQTMSSIVERINR